MLSEIKQRVFSHLPLETKCWLRHWRHYRSYRSMRNATGRSDPVAVFDDMRCVFVHIPKTGGKSIKQALFGKLKGGHKSAEELMCIFGPARFKRYFSFAFARNPFERLVSAYTYLKKGGINEGDKRFSDKHLAGYESFHAFVMDWVNPSNVQLYYHFRPQHQYIYSGDGRCLVDMVGHLETIEQDSAKIRARLGVEASLPHRNSTPRKRSYESFYKTYSKRKTFDVYKRDFKLLGYDREKFMQ